MTDVVNHPSHYTSHASGVECIEVTEHFNFNLGNAIKYIWRADNKGKANQDLKKALWYIQRELDRRARVEEAEGQARLDELVKEADRWKETTTNHFFGIPVVESEAVPHNQAIFINPDTIAEMFGPPDWPDVSWGKGPDLTLGDFMPDMNPANREVIDFADHTWGPVTGEPVAAVVIDEEPIETESCFD